MGLAVSYGIIQEHDGAIDVDSSPGEGTCFTICLPPVSSEVTVSESAEARGLSSKVSVLVVDDQQMICDVVDRLLTLKGHRVTQANTGEVAIALARHRSFDIAFTDLGLPDISGYQVAAELRAGDPDLPIVLMTGHTERQIDETIIDMIIDKPFKIAQVEEAIQQLLPTSTSSGSGGD